MLRVHLVATPGNDAEIPSSHQSFPVLQERLSLIIFLQIFLAMSLLGPSHSLLPVIVTQIHCISHSSQIFLCS